MNFYEEVSKIEREDYQGDYIPRPRKPEPVKKRHYDINKTHTYLQETISDYSPSFHWDNKTLFKDQDALFALAHQVSESRLKSILDWCKERQVHIKVVLKLLNKSLK